MDISRDEFYRVIQDLKVDLKEDLAAIRDHLGTLNGRTLKGEVSDAELRLMVTELRKERDAQERYQDRRPRHSGGGEGVGQGEAWASNAVSKREGALIGFGLVIVTVLMKALELVGTKLWDVLVHHP